MTNINSGDFLGVKVVKDCQPNGDPQRDNDARQILNKEGIVSISDVSVKRDIRDSVLEEYSNSVAQRHPTMSVVVRAERTKDGNLLGRQGLVESVLADLGIDFSSKAGKAQLEKIINQVFWDARTFGLVYSIKDASFHTTGPVQFGYGHSLHIVRPRFIQGIGVMPSKDERTDVESGKTNGKKAGTIWTQYIIPFGVFAIPGVVCPALAAKTGMNNDDLEVLFKHFVLGTMRRQSRSKNGQRPVFLIHVEYHKPGFNIGYLEEGIKIKPDDDTIWLGDEAPHALKDITLDVSSLAETLSLFEKQISRVRVWHDPRLNLEGALPGEDWKLI